jgi:creatinine amidohydrolase
MQGVCFLTGHAGGTHGARIIEAGEYLLQHTGLQVAPVSVMDLLVSAKNFLQCARDSHAGEMETSLALALWPQMVKGTAAEAYPDFPANILVRDKLARWPSGVWGDPGLASAEKGYKLLAAEADALVEIMERLRQECQKNTPA